MRSAAGKTIFTLVVLAGLGWLGFAVYRKISAEPEEGAAGGGRGGRAAVSIPVEVAPIRRGEIRDERTFSGTLQPAAEFVVAPKVAGRIVAIHYDVGDRIRRGETAATLDSAEFVQAVAQAEAEPAVARANLTEAESALATAERSFERVKTLHERGVASDSQFDAAAAELQARTAALEVAKAQIDRADAAVKAAEIREAYSAVVASWTGGDDERTIAERYADPGQTVAANSPILSVVEMNPLKAIVHVTDRDYGRLRVGQEAVLVTDMWGEEKFPARILRLSPIFREATRQAPVEFEVPNEDGRLRPGMFVRVNVTLDRRENATIVPVEALAIRDDKPGLFVLPPEGDAVRYVPVRVGIRSGRVVEVEGDGLEGSVVTLGQQLLEDGSQVRVPEATR